MRSFSTIKSHESSQFALYWAKISQFDKAKFHVLHIFCLIRCCDLAIDSYGSIMRFVKMVLFPNLHFNKQNEQKITLYRAKNILFLAKPYFTCFIWLSRYLKHICQFKAQCSLKLIFITHEPTRMDFISIKIFVSLIRIGKVLTS
jgi:hypothetical protein